MALGLGKWSKHKILSKSSELRTVLPHTRLFNKKNFTLLLNKYSNVIVKPSAGSGGAGVMQIMSAGDGSYTVQYGKINKTISGHSQTYHFVRSKTRKNYIVQQRISLAKVNGKPFDVRVMVQRKRGSSWVVTGMLAKIAGSGYFITNIVRSKGSALPLHTAIHRSNIKGSSSGIQDKINQITLTAAKRLQQNYRINTIGLDVGIDTNGKVWIIEANFMPDKTYFLRLKNKSMYKRIMSFYRNR